MESKDPYSDFRLSMEEMVTIYGVRDWQCLEELLEWYLRVNGRPTTDSSSAPSSTFC
ncbi:unnamed protein product [Spirodela intermedia]|uniref:Transcription repressor n=1 Tax=Spirodela intermedia TaxID=51605 RepID=A0A7I8ISW7_SPIIN|nr:unnamed protein product [Spirodela intermedia]CAA6660620.1 unnamed protein product [Spirodela intermedia]